MSLLYNLPVEEMKMFDARQYINSSVAVRLGELDDAVEYSLVAEYNTHVVQLRSGVFLVSTEDAAKVECEYGGHIIAVRGEMTR